jgi:hypothetical protein
MQVQLNEKDILLYVNHGKDYTEDIGILTKSEILENGDLYHEYRGYNEADDVPQRNKDLVQQIYKQANGLPPYQKTRSFGFSIEGIIPDGMVEWSPSGNIINKVDLDPGVSLVTKPAYLTSVAHAIKKALNLPDLSGNKKESTTETAPKENEADTPEKIITMVDQYINDRKSKVDHIAEVDLIEEAFETSINSILKMKEPSDIKRNKLINEFNSFRDRMIELYSQFDYNIPGGFVTPLERSMPKSVSVPNQSKKKKSVNLKYQILKQRIYSNGIKNHN